MVEIVRTEAEISEVIEWCFEASENGSHYSGMSYEDGIRAAIDWITGDCEDSPME